MRAIPRPLPLWLVEADIEERGAEVQVLLDGFVRNLAALLDDTAQNTPGGLDRRWIDALYEDLVAEVAGALQVAARSVAEMVS